MAGVWTISLQTMIMKILRPFFIEVYTFQNFELDLKRFLSFSTLHHKHVVKIVHYNHSSLHHDYFFFFMQAKKSFDDESKQGALKVASAAAS